MIWLALPFFILLAAAALFSRRRGQIRSGDPEEDLAPDPLMARFNASGFGSGLNNTFKRPRN